jgi:hypothetical protein
MVSTHITAELGIVSHIKKLMNITGTNKMLTYGVTWWKFISLGAFFLSGNECEKPFIP